MKRPEATREGSRGSSAPLTGGHVTAQAPTNIIRALFLILKMWPHKYLFQGRFYNFIGQMNYYFTTILYETPERIVFVDAHDDDEGFVQNTPNSIGGGRP